jgi:hypothetical protein
MLLAASSILTAACSFQKLPIVGGPSDLQTESVRSIKTIQVRRIAVMPLIDIPDQTGKTIAEGASDAVTAELYSQMAIMGGWEIVPESDVSRAMQKLPPTTARNLEANALALGREVSADAVLYGTVERYKERVGVDYAAASPASVAFTLHLIDVRSKQAVWTAKFAKSQKALTENVLNLVNFVRNQGRWVRAHEIAMEGVKEAVADLRQQLALNENIKRFETGTYEELKRGEHRYEPAAP